MSSTIERAFELAKGSSCRTIKDIRRRLHAERFDAVEAHTSGSLVTRQLNELLARHRLRDLTNGSDIKQSDPHEEKRYAAAERSPGEEGGT